MQANKSSFKRTRIVALLLIFLFGSLPPGGSLLRLLSPIGHANSTAQTLPFSQDWSNTGLITTDDDWSSVPGIEGFRGDGLTAANDVDPQTIVSGDDMPVLDVSANKTNPDTFTTGGVAEFEITDPVIALQGSGTADAPYIRIYLNTTGLMNIMISSRVLPIHAAFGCCKSLI